MANRVYIIPRRNDLAGVGLTLTDLKPNAGQKNNVYDGQHQNVYVVEPLDQPGTTTVNGVSYVSGSLNTTLLAAHNDIDDDTTGGGDDCSATQQTALGLAAYLLDRVQATGAGGPPLSIAQANAAATAIVAVVEAGTALGLTEINALLVVAAGAGTELTTAGGSDSFGTVEEILRILSGEVYRLPVLTVLGDAAALTGVFWDLATRQVLVAAQTPAEIAAQGQFYASGGFLTGDDAGYRARPLMVRTGALNASLLNGVLSHYKGNITLVNSTNFAYSAGAVTAWKPRAVDIAGNAIPVTGVHQALAVYADDGSVL